MITRSEILYSCESLVVIHMATAWYQSGITASVDSAKPGSVLTAVQMLKVFTEKLGFCNLPKSLCRCSLTSSSTQIWLEKA